MRPFQQSVLLLMVFLVACGDDAAPCVSRSNCEAAEVCVNGSCAAAPADSSVGDARSPLADAGTLDVLATLDAEPDAMGAGPDAMVPESVVECEAHHRQALYFDGDGFIFAGTQLITDENAALVLSSFAGGGVWLRVVPEDVSLGRDWTTQFAAPDAAELVEQVYLNANEPTNMGPEAGRGSTRSV